MARFELFAVLCATWAAFRVLAGRATLATRDFARLFIVGLAGSTTAALLLERLVRSATLHQAVTGIYAGPIEELAKALPLLAMLAFFGSWRRLTLADWALAGLAGAAGFTFGQWWIQLSVPESDWPKSWHWYLLGSGLSNAPGQLGEIGDGLIYFSGAATTAFVGLLVGLGVRLGRSRRTGIALGFAGLALTAIENGIYRYEVGPLATFSARAYGELPRLAVFAERVLMQGRLDLWLFIAGLFVASWTEGRWALASVPKTRRVLLADEATVPLVLAEWIVAARRAADHGWTVFERVNRYFRERRQYMVALADLVREPRSEPLVAEVVDLRNRLVLDREALVSTSGLRAFPAWPFRQPSLGRWVRDYPLQIVGLVAAIVVLAVFPSDLPDFLADAIGSAIVAFALALAAVVLAFGGLRRARVPSPGVEGQDARDLQLLTLGTGFLTGILALLVSFVPTFTLIPDLGQRTFLLEPIELWASGAGYPRYGGNPHTLLALLAFLAVCAHSRFSARTAMAREAPAQVHVEVAGRGV